MLPLIKKDRFAYVLALIPVYPIIALVFSVFEVKHYEFIVFINCLFIFLVSMFAFSTVEIEFEKSNVYHLLSILPLRNFEIIAAKFIMYLFTFVFLAFWVQFFSKFMFTFKTSLLVNNQAVLLCTQVGLIVNALSLIGAFILGVNKFLQYSSIVLGSAGLLGSLLGRLADSRFQSLQVILKYFEQILKSLLHQNVMSGILFTLLIYFLLFVVAVYVKNHLDY